MTVPCDEGGAKVGGAWAKVRHHCTWKRELLPIKLILFLYTGGMTAFLPFLTLQMKQLGITVKEIAVIHAFLPVASLLGPPTSGLVADVFRQYRAVLGGNIVLTLTLHCLLLQVPPRPPVTLSLSCGEGGHALTWGYCSPCHGRGGEGGELEGFAYPESPTLTLKECRSTCPDMSEVQLCLHEGMGGESTCHRLNYSSQLTLHGSLLSWRHTPTNLTTTTTTTNSSPLTTTTVSPPLLLVPPPEAPPLPFTSTSPTCGHTYRLIKGVTSGGGGGGGVGGKGEGRREEKKKKEEEEDNLTHKEDETRGKGGKEGGRGRGGGGGGGGNEITKTGGKEEGRKEETGGRTRLSNRQTRSATNAIHKQAQTPEEANKENGGKRTENGGRDAEKTGKGQINKLDTRTTTTTTPTTTTTTTTTEGEWTHLTCPNLPHTCPIECKVDGFPRCEDPSDPALGTLTFWVYFVIRILGTFFLASSFTMMDATSLALVKQHDAEFGKQRILATIGQATVPLLAGVIVDAHSASLGYSDYMPAIYLGSSLALIATLIVLRLDVKVETGSENIVKDLKKLITKVEIDLFLLMILILGSNWGFIESYLFLYLSDLNAPNYLLGLTLTVGCITGVPIMYVADKVIEKLGRPAIFIISFFTYAARHFGYAFMTDPWIVFPYELLEIFTYQIMWVAAVTYCHVLAPKGLLATMTGLAGSIHYSLGRGLGSLFGGYLIANLGMAITFRIFGYISLSGGIFYLLVHFFYARRKRSKEDEDEEKDEKENEEAFPMMDLGIRRGSEGFAP